MIKINNDITAKDLLPKIENLWSASAAKIHSIEQTTPAGSPAVYMYKSRAMG